MQALPKKDVAASEVEDLEELAWRGIELCRTGDWQAGVYCLGRVMEGEASGEEEIPGLFYAYLGYGMARYHDRPEQGLELCRRALEMDRYQPESYYFLARLYLLIGDRRSAFQVVERGLEIATDDSRLLEVWSELGERRPPVLPFLARRHPLNRYLGRVRHHLLDRGVRTSL